MITQVNGKPAISIPVYELRRQWREEKPGTVVNVMVKRGASARRLTIILRDQI